MMFKGTPRRTALDVNLDFDRIGASYNAYTSEENTVYYAAVLPEYLPKAVDILADILRPSLRQADFDTEKKVILEEIKMYEDQPGSVACDHARRLYYTAHPLGNSVLGTTPERRRSHVATRCTPTSTGATSRTTSSCPSAGNFDWQRLVNLAGEACSGWNTADVGRDNRTEWSGPPALHVLTREKVQQEYVLFLTGGPPADSKLRYAADTLALAVGDDSGSRLYWGLVDPGLADSADCSYYENDGSGCVYVSYTCEPERDRREPRHRPQDSGGCAARRHHRGRVETGEEQDRFARGPRQRAADGPDAGHRRRVDLHRRVPRRGHGTGELRRGHARRRPGLPRQVPASTAAPSSPSAPRRCWMESRGRRCERSTKTLASDDDTPIQVRNTDLQFANGLQGLLFGRKEEFRKDRRVDIRSTFRHQGV